MTRPDLRRIERLLGAHFAPNYYEHHIRTRAPIKPPMREQLPRSKRRGAPDLGSNGYENQEG